MRIVKVYTKTGDKGLTSLADGSRISKDNIRIESYGTIDELNCILGICKESLIADNNEKFFDIRNWILAIQNDLFNIGSDLATPIEHRWENMLTVSEEDIKKLEKLIDFCQEKLTPLKEFVLPGGSLSNSYFHLARTVCRRAERLIVSLSKETDINENIIPYVNRLSDFLFVLSRYVLIVAQSNKEEILWNKNFGMRSLNF